LTACSIGSYFPAERVKNFTSAIGSYTDTSLSIADRRAGQHVIEELERIKSLKETLLCARNAKEKSEHPELPYCGDPLAEMNVQGTDPNNFNNRIGGTYGCKRSTVEKRTQCEEWSKNIKNFPVVSGKNKVHDGLDLSTNTGTPIYAMYEGTVFVGYSETVGNYVQIISTKNQHGLSFESNTITIWYGHLLSYQGNLNGKTVQQGTLIGHAGNSGSIAASIENWQYHLHLTIYKNNTSSKYNRINPINYLTTKFDENGNKK
jgi:hypothetical protein